MKETEIKLKVCRKPDCIKGDEEQPLTNFYKQSTGTNGRHSYCKSCFKKINAKNYKPDKWRKYYKDNEEHYSNYQKEYYEENRDYIKKRVKIYNKKNQARITELVYKWRSQNKEKVKAHNQVTTALRNGSLIKPLTCECCDLEKFIEFHHFDYERPLDGVWLCRSKHRTYHRGNNLKVVAEVDELIENKYFKE